MAKAKVFSASSAGFPPTYIDDVVDMCRSFGYAMPFRVMYRPVGDGNTTVGERMLTPALREEGRRLAAQRRIYCVVFTPRRSSSPLAIDYEAIRLLHASGFAMRVVGWALGGVTVQTLAAVHAASGLGSQHPCRPEWTGRRLRPEHAPAFKRGFDWLTQIFNAVTKKDRERVVNDLGLELVARVGYAIMTCEDWLGRTPRITWSTKRTRRFNGVQK